MATILVIDDDVGIRTLVRAILEAEGHRVREAADGLAGLAAFVAERPDVVICDLFMPKRDGHRMIRDLRRRGIRTPIIAMSGGASWDQSSAHLYLSAGQRLGASRCLAKPFTPYELQLAVRESLLAVPVRAPYPPGTAHYGPRRRNWLSRPARLWSVLRRTFGGRRAS